MRAAVYNRYLATMGGGERYTGMLAAGLAVTSGSVDLIGHGDVDLAALEEHLGIDLTGVTLRLVPDSGEDSISELSAEYDLFVNASYMSRIRSQARHSSYAVYFPTPWDHDLTRFQRAVSRTLGPHVREASSPFQYGRGWFPPEGAGVAAGPGLPGRPSCCWGRVRPATWCSRSDGPVRRPRAR